MVRAVAARLPRWETLAGGLCLFVLLLQLGLLALPLFGYRSFAILTGSMAPTLPVGSLIVTKGVAGAAVGPGDVITYPLPSDPSVDVTHRVVSTGRDAAGAFLVTKGDANAVTDGWHVPAGENVDLLVADVPFAGYMTSFAVRVLLAVLAALFLVRRRPPAEQRATVI